MFSLISLAGISSVALLQGIAQRGIEVPNAIVKQHNAYVLCQDEHFDASNVHDQRTVTAEVEKSIAACAERKVRLMEEAEKILASVPGYEDPIKQRTAISTSFDGYDEMRREMARGWSK